MKKLFSIFGLLILLFSVLAITGCDELAEKYFGFNNNSSHSVTVSVVGEGTSFTLAPGQSQSVWLGENVTIDDIIYQPANLVSVSRTGNAFFFRDR